MAKTLQNKPQPPSEDTKKNLYMTEKGVYITDNHDLLNLRDSKPVTVDFISYEETFRTLENFTRIVFVRATNFRQKVAGGGHTHNQASGPRLLYVIDFNSSSSLSTGAANLNMFALQFQRMRFVRELHQGNNQTQTQNQLVRQDPVKLAALFKPEAARPLVHCNSTSSTFSVNTNVPAKREMFLAIREFHNYLISSKEPDNSYFTITFEHLIATISLPEVCLAPDHKKALISLVVYFWPRLFFLEHDRNKLEMSDEGTQHVLYQIFNSVSELIVIKFEDLEVELTVYAVGW